VSGAPGAPKPGNPSDLDLALAQARTSSNGQLGGAWASVHWQAIRAHGEVRPRALLPQRGSHSDGLQLQGPLRAADHQAVSGADALLAPCCPGSRILRITGNAQRFALVAYSQARKSLSVTALNQDAQSATLSLAFAGKVELSANRAALSLVIYRTSAGESSQAALRALRERDPAKETPSVTLLGQSLTTVVLSNAIVRW